LAPDPPRSKTKGSKKRIRGSHILIVADESIVKDLIAQLLMSKGGKVTTVSSSIECYKLFKKNHFDLVIIELDTPNLNASAMIPKIRKLDPGLAVALIDAGSQKKSLNRFRKMGAEVIVGRPLDMDRVFSLLSRILSNESRSTS
jgi:DNA-binding NtrC family response regulator